MIKSEVWSILKRAGEELQEEGLFPDLDWSSVSLGYPEEFSHGDFATNIALRAASVSKQSPREMAEHIASRMERIGSSVIEKAEAAGPGFVNIFLSKELLFQQLQEAQEEAYGSQNTQKGKKVMVEFTDPNPFKEFHIGHLYSNMVGESLSRLLEASGAEVKRANYQGDVGAHVAKAIWGMKKMVEEGISLQDLKAASQEARVEFLGASYAQGANAYEEDEEAKREIQELNKKVFARDSEVQELYEQGKAWSMEAFEDIYRRLGTKFDYYYLESQVASKGLQTVREGLAQGTFEESRGAVIFPGEKHGLHSRVFIGSQGLPTYEAKELGLAPAKYQDFPYDQSVIITGNEVNEYFRVLLKALSLLYPELAAKTVHIGHGMVRLPEGKMSSRTGTVIRAQDLLEEVKTRVRVILESSRRSLSKEEQEQLAEQVAVGAVKYSFLKVSVGKDIVFDFATSLNTEGNSAPYLQYTHARCRSILREAKELPSFIPDKSLSPREEVMLRLLSRFPDVVWESAEKLAPSLLCSYVYDLAQAYNSFYYRHRVLKADSAEKEAFRLYLTSATALVLKRGLYLLGIQAPEEAGEPSLT